MKNHGSINLQKPTQGIFYGNPLQATEEAWQYAQAKSIKPINVNGKDYYVIPRANSGYEAGMGGQLQLHDHLTIITAENSNKVITAFPSGANPMPFPKDYQFLLEEQLKNGLSLRR